MSSTWHVPQLDPREGPAIAAAFHPNGPARLRVCFDSFSAPHEAAAQTDVAEATDAAAKEIAKLDAVKRFEKLRAQVDGARDKLAKLDVAVAALNARRDELLATEEISPDLNGMIQLASKIAEAQAQAGVLRDWIKSLETKLATAKAEALQAARPVAKASYSAYRDLLHTAREKLANDLAKKSAPLLDGLAVVEASVYGIQDVNRFVAASCVALA